MKKTFLSIAIICSLIISCKPQKELQAPCNNTEIQTRLNQLNNTVDSLIISMTSTNEETLNNGVIGDVKYSVLPKPLFQELNGDCWWLLDSSDFQNTDLWRFTRNIQSGLGNNLPDGRGVFIRGMMGRDMAGKNKDTAYGDQDKKRTVGKLQMDQVGFHIHLLTLKGAFGDGEGNHDPKFGGDDRETSIKKPTPTDDSFPKNETRPKNIALYIYIKVNNDCGTKK